MTSNVSGPAGLLEILSWARPHDSETEKRFCREFLDVVPGMRRDAFGNRMVRIGDARVIWSCHVDTVAVRDGPQLIAVSSDGTASLAKGKAGMSLGADDGAGVWIMLNMIAAGRPGLYVFHRGEERGCLGSSWIRKNTPALLEGLDAAIAFDRQGFGDVITHQASGRTCSDAFADSMSAALNGLEPSFRYKPDDTGIYTDTNEYARIIPECSNLSVGYHGQHGPRETLDIGHCVRLLDAMLAFDFASVTIERDPTAEDEDDWGWNSFGFRDWTSENDDFEEAIKAHPGLARELLEGAGYDLREFDDLIWKTVADSYRPKVSA